MTRIQDSQVTRKNVMKAAHQRAKERLFPNKTSYKEAFAVILKACWECVKRNERKAALLALPVEEHINIVLAENKNASANMKHYMASSIRSERAGRSAMPVDVFFNN